eukprot:gnl/TRDRNA2_/TRDRNA2_176585_c1_seq1.p1 gnl/TRDRNA2_/TRDRNA2_176585_c1~~gnl/TRDRNA2_/TRDRNA2_176585_c1_seq1.p1  ORF type:complete len:762 (-),score=59.24 gnl/TRDRNA2_/TRDRNA2_176585_c1_seq1:142-2427(-)
MVKDTETQEPALAARRSQLKSCTEFLLGPVIHTMDVPAVARAEMEQRVLPLCLYSENKGKLRRPSDGTKDTGSVRFNFAKSNSSDMLRRGAREDHREDQAKAVPEAERTLNEAWQKCGTEIEKLYYKFDKSKGECISRNSNIGEDIWDDDEDGGLWDDADQIEEHNSHVFACLTLERAGNGFGVTALQGKNQGTCADLCSHSGFPSQTHRVCDGAHCDLGLCHSPEAFQLTLKKGQVAWAFALCDPKNDQDDNLAVEIDPTACPSDLYETLQERYREMVDVVEFDSFAGKCRGSSSYIDSDSGCCNDDKECELKYKRKAFGCDCRGLPADLCGFMPNCVLSTIDCTGDKCECSPFDMRKNYGCQCADTKQTADNHVWLSAKQQQPDEPFFSIYCRKKACLAAGCNYKSANNECVQMTNITYKADTAAKRKYVLLASPSECEFTITPDPPQAAFIACITSSLGYAWKTRDLLKDSVEKTINRFKKSELIRVLSGTRAKPPKFARQTVHDHSTIPTQPRFPTYWVDLLRSTSKRRRVNDLHECVQDYHATLNPPGPSYSSVGDLFGANSANIDRLRETLMLALANRIPPMPGNGLLTKTRYDSSSALTKRQGDITCADLGSPSTTDDTCPTTGAPADILSYYETLWTEAYEGAAGLSPTPKPTPSPTDSPTPAPTPPPTQSPTWDYYNWFPVTTGVAPLTPDEQKILDENMHSMQVAEQAMEEKAKDPVGKGSGNGGHHVGDDWWMMSEPEDYGFSYYGFSYY